MFKIYLKYINKVMIIIIMVLKNEIIISPHKKTDCMNEILLYIFYNFNLQIEFDL